MFSLSPPQGEGYEIGLLISKTANTNFFQHNPLCEHKFFPKAISHTTCSEKWTGVTYDINHWAFSEELTDDILGENFYIIALSNYRCLKPASQLWGKGLLVNKQPGKKLTGKERLNWRAAE